MGIWDDSEGGRGKREKKILLALVAGNFLKKERPGIIFFDANFGFMASFEQVIFFCMYCSDENPFRKMKSPFSKIHTYSSIFFCPGGHAISPTTVRTFIPGPAADNEFFSFLIRE